MSSIADRVGERGEKSVTSRDTNNRWQNPSRPFGESGINVHSERRRVFLLWQSRSSATAHREKIPRQ